MNRSIVWLIVALAVVAVVSWWGLRPHGGGASAFRVASVEVGPIEATVSATGTVQPVEQVEVGSQVSGTVDKLYADYNSRVTEGQILCQLEPSSFRARVVQAEAAVAHAEAAVQDGDRALKRARELRDENVISDVELEAAEVESQQRQADLKSAQAALEAARVDLMHTTIRSPIDGVVISRSIDLGQTVAASLQAPRLFVIARNLAQMQVETRIDEADIGRIHPDLPVSFTVDAYPDLTFHGRVSQVRLEPIVDQGVVTYTIIVGTENPDQKLRPGMTANVSVLVDHRENAMKVPNAALRFQLAAAAGRGGRGSRPQGAGMGGGAAGGSTGAAARGGAGAGGPGGSGPGRGVAAGGAPDHGGRGHWGAGLRAGGPAVGAVADSGRHAEDTLKPGTVYVERGGKPVAVQVMTGITDGAMTEVLAADLKPDDQVIVGYDLTTRGPTLQPPPGMGGPQFRGPRPAGGRR